MHSVLEATLRGGEPSAAGTAARMMMSVRTLTRTLAAEHTTYRKVLDQLRYELASRHLANPRISIGEVAFLLGFSELSAFYRAFRRWTGQTPAEFRNDRPAHRFKAPPSTTPALIDAEVGRVCTVARRAWPPSIW